MRSLAAVLIACLACAAAPYASAQDIRLHVSEDSVTVGERFYVSIAAEHEFAAAPSFPDPSREDSLVFGDLEVLRLQRRDSYARAQSRVDSVVYEVVTFALDTARVAAIPVVFTAGEDTFSVRTEPTSVFVESLVPEDADDVQDLAPLVEFPVSPWIYVAAAAALLLLAALVAFFLWRRRNLRGREPDRAPIVPKTPPDVEAFERLRKLERFDLADSGAIKPFYVELSDTLRNYVSRRLGVHALESTTTELVRDLERKRLPDAETTGRLRNVLVQSDYVKFADTEPPEGESRALIGTSRSIIESIEQQIQPDAEVSEHSEGALSSDPQANA